MIDRLFHVFKFIKVSQDGLTLMELIISITMLSIISLAAFSGLQFAYYVMASSDQYVEEAYESQGDFEVDLSQVTVLPSTTDKTSLVLETMADNMEDEVIEFDWETGTTLTDFKTTGVTIERSVEGGDYLGDVIYIYLPVLNEDQ